MVDIAEILFLPESERRAIFDALRSSLRPPIATRADALLDVAAQLIGEPSIPERSQKPIYVNARAVVAYQLREEGYSLQEIGAQLHRNHSSVTHLLYKIEWAKAYPSVYFEILQLLKQFKSRIDENHK